VALACDLHFAVDEVDRALFMVRIEWHAGALRRSHLGVEPGRYHRDWRRNAERIARNDTRSEIALGDHRQVARGVMLERRRDLFLARGQRGAALQTQHLLALAALYVRLALGMRDAPAGSRSNHGAGLAFLSVALASATPYRA